MAGERVNIVKDGFVQSVPVEQAAQAASDGWELATDEQTSRYKYEREVMARPGAQFEAGFEGFSRAVSLGASDAVLAAIVDDEERKAMGVRSETDAASVGEALGTGATLLSATGALRALGGRAAAAEGSALLRGGGRALQMTDGALARTPLGIVTRGAARVGEAVEQGVIGNATAGVARRALARGVGLGTEGAIEGAAVGAGQEVSEAALGDTELTAQKLLAGAGKGALFGGLTGVAIGAPLGALSGATSRALGRSLDSADGAAEAAALTSAVGHVAPDIAGTGLGGKAIDLYSSVASKVSGKPKEDIAFGLSNRNARQDFMRLGELRGAAVKRATETLDQMKSIEQFERRLAAGDIKATNVARTIRRGEGVAEMQTHHAARLVEEVASQVKRADMDRLVGVSNRKEVEYLVEAARKDLAAAAKSKDAGASANTAMETFKRGLADLRQRASGSVSAARAAPMKPRDARQMEQFANWADIYSTKARLFLEDTEVWGTAAAHQAERNAAISAMMRTKGDFDGRFFKKLKETQGGRRVETADPAKIETYFNHLNDWRKDYAHVQTIRHLDDRAKLYETLERNGEVPEELAGEFGRAKETLQRLKADFAEMGERIGNANRVRSLAEQDAADRMMGGMGGAVIGSVAGGPIGAAAGFALDALRNPAAVVQKVAAIESLADRVRRVDAKIGNSVRSFVRQETAPALREGSERQVRRSIRASSAGTAAVVATQANERKRTKEVQRKVDAVREYVRDPVPSTDAFVRRAMRGVSDYAPGVAMGIAGTHGRAMQFLAAKLPPIPRTQLSVLQPQLEGHVLAPSQVDKLARYIGAIEEPVEIIEDMRTGLLSPEAVEAIQAVYPDLYASMRNTAILEVASAKEPLSHTAVVRLSLLFGFAGSPTLEPAFQMTHTQVLGQRQQAESQGSPPPPSGEAPDMTANSQTMSQRLVVGM